MTVSFCMLVYVLSFFTISPAGLRILFVSGTEFLAGGVIPLPFFPEKVERILELNPWASMGNVPFRIYGGDLAGQEMLRAMCIQVIWLVVLVAAGRLLCAGGEKRAVVQGG